MSDAPSVPPSSGPPPLPGDPPAQAVSRVIRLDLHQPEDRGSWRKRRASGDDRHVTLVGSEIVFEHPGVLRSPLTFPAGLVAIAAVDDARSRQAGEQGRFAILRRLSGTAVVPQSDGVEGWLWTPDSGSVLPLVGEGPPNLALVFVKPLDEALVEDAFWPDFLTALAQHSPLGATTIHGLLARVSDAVAAENAFRELGVAGAVTDREIAPAQRRHLAGDRPANPSIGPLDDRRRETSVPPPGGGRRSTNR